MKTISVTVPFDVTTQVIIDRNVLTDLGLEDHIDTLERKDLYSLHCEGPLFLALTTLIETEVRERLSASDFVFEADLSNSFWFLKEDHVKQVAR
jgi:hypothetical protein